jgi:hypothetical protein
MSSRPTLAGSPGAAFGAIFRNEARLVWRQPAGAIAAIGISLLILVIFGELPVFRQPSSRIAAVAPTSGAVRGITAAVFYPLVFFSGLYYPVQLMPSVMLDISHFTPLGAAVQAIVYPMFGEFPPASSLLVLGAYALVFGFLAKRSFRWE